MASLNAIAAVAEDPFQRSAMYFLLKKIIVYLEASEHDQVESSFEEAKAPFKWAGISHKKLFSPKRS